MNTSEKDSENLKRAKFLHEQAQEKGSADLYDSAGNYYYKAGWNQEANECWDIADRLRKAE